MAHLFKQMYSDDIQNVKCIAKTDIIQAITVEFIMKEKGRELWAGSDQTRMLIKRQQLWRLIRDEVFQILNYEKPTNKHQKIYEQIFNLSYSELQTIYSNINRTVTFKNLIDYLTCVCKMKYSV